MQTYVILRRGAWATAQDLAEGADKSLATAAPATVSYRGSPSPGEYRRPVVRELPRRLDSALDDPDVW